MIPIYVNEIKKSLENECYFSALSLALALPDICGAAEFPDESVGKRYIGWYDQYVEKEESSKNKEQDVSWLNGEMVYNLRNTFYHNGSPNLTSEKIKTPINKLDGFALVLGEGLDAFDIAINTETVVDGHKLQYNALIVNLILLCERICNAALKYYTENKDKMQFDCILIPGLCYDYQVRDIPLDDRDPILDSLNRKLAEQGCTKRLNAKNEGNLTKDFIDKALKQLRENGGRRLT